jgi:hypothetical protein
METNKSLLMLFNDYKKVMDSIASCTTIEHHDSIDNMINNFYSKWNKEDYINTIDKFYNKLKKFNLEKRNEKQ